MKNQSNSIRLSGNLSAAEQLFAGKYQHKQESMKLSPYQERLFQIALKGYEALTAAERAKLTYNDRKTLERAYGVTKRVLNSLRQQYATNTISHLFDKLFPNAKGSALPLLMMNVVDGTMTSRVSLKVPKEALIKRLVQEGVLPKNEFQKFAA